MSDKRIAWITHANNFAAEEDTDITVSSTDNNSIYPAENLKTVPSSEVWRSFDAATQTLLFDLGTARSVNIIALVTHNLSSAATITIQAGPTSGVASFSVSMTWREAVAFKYLSTAQTYRWWKITLSDASNPYGFIEVGYPIIGSLVKPEFTMQQGWTDADQIVNSRVETEFGTPYTEEIYRCRRLSLSFGPLTSAQAAQLSTLYRECNRNAKPFLLLPEREGTEAYFGRLMNMFSDKLDFYDYVDVEFEEDNVGHSVDL